MSISQKMQSDIESVLNALIASTISSDEAAERIYTVGTDFIRARSVPGSLADGDEHDVDLYGDPTTPGVPSFFYELWSTLLNYIDRVPAEEHARDDCVARLVDTVRQLKAKPQLEGKDWLIAGDKCRWDSLPHLGRNVRDVYYDIDTTHIDPAVLRSQEAQAAVAGALQLEPQHLASEDPVSDTINLAKSRHRWLSLQAFISGLWRDCGCNEYDIYAIWALRPALEDWPESPPACGAQYETLEDSPAYLAFQVEAASIWICNTAPLMYRCTTLMGPNGVPDWDMSAGAPGRGGRRWKGVDGYDSEHKRWQVWKGVLGEVVQWCDRQGKDQMKGWKVKDAAIRSLEALKAAEHQ
ncbi:hypothetical protein RSOLAG22IIIB_10997 [Rhizoctonia solani]|uniref:Uncharacterized protein n=1 Tax=Rhizoctonia solani TaxID=456999 RepID=A0A0K6G6R5_9AGAM|nr:hypothetical protein RSOLAG22IIIB_10997 [Rhizoctonia solani]